MKLAVTVQMQSEGAVAAGVAFDDWAAPEPTRTFRTTIARIEKPERGALDLRELPGLLQLLREHGLAPELIVIDGLVHLDAQETAGLGQHLHHALGGQVAVIGICKTAVRDMPAQFELMREEETRPLIITCAGIDLGAAKARVRLMHGRKRVPTLMKLVTRIAKGSAD